MCSALASLALALHAATTSTRPRHGSCQALFITLTRQPEPLSDSVSRALFMYMLMFMCSTPAFCAWRRLPLICLKLSVGVCVRDGLAAEIVSGFEVSK